MIGRNQGRHLASDWSKPRQPRAASPNIASVHKCTRVQWLLSVRSNNIKRVDGCVLLMHKKISKPLLHCTEILLAADQLIWQPVQCSVYMCTLTLYTAVCIGVIHCHCLALLRCLILPHQLNNIVIYREIKYFQILRWMSTQHLNAVQQGPDRGIPQQHDGNVPVHRVRCHTNVRYTAVYCSRLRAQGGGGNTRVLGKNIGSSTWNG